MIYFAIYIKKIFRNIMKYPICLLLVQYISTIYPKILQSATFFMLTLFHDLISSYDCYCQYQLWLIYLNFSFYNKFNLYCYDFSNVCSYFIFCVLDIIKDVVF